MKKNIVFILFIFTALCNHCYAGNKKPPQADNCCSIAYIDLEILYQKYKKVADIAEEKVKRQEEDIATFNRRKDSFDKDAKDFQQKIENNAFLSAETANREHKRLMKMESDLDELNITMKLSREKEETEKNKQIETLILEATQRYNETSKFQFIFTKKGFNNIITANTEHDITEEILRILNSEYATEKDSNNQ